MPDWEEIFFRDVYNYSTKSKDPRTHVGAVLVDWNTKNSFSHGYNGFPRKVIETKERWSRENKANYSVHAEENSILNCARHGHKTEGTVLFTNGIPCSLCAKSICNVGIKEIIVHKQWRAYEKEINPEKFTKASELSESMFREARISLRVYDKFLNVEALLDGIPIKV